MIYQIQLIEEMRKNDKKTFVLKPIQNRLKIDSFQPEMNIRLNQSKIRSQSRKRTNIKTPIKTQQPKSIQNLTVKQTKPLNLPNIIKKQPKQNQDGKIQSRKSVISNHSHKSLKQHPVKRISVKKPSSNSIDQAQNNSFSVENLEKDMQQLIGYFEEVLTHMTKKQMLNISGAWARIKKDKLLCLLLFVSKSIMNLNPTKCQVKKNCQQVQAPPEILPTFQKIAHLTNQIMKEKTVVKLSLDSSVINFENTGQKYIKQVEKRSLNIANHIDKQRQLYNILEKIEKQVSYRSDYCESIQKQARQAEITVFTMKSQVQSLQTQQNQLQTKVEQLSKTLEQLQKKGQEVFLFVQTQNQRVFLHEVSQNYKKKQLMMYDYAYQLSHNPEMHSYCYQPKPFKEMQKSIKYEMQKTIQTLQQPKLSNPQRQKIMKEFITNTMKKFNYKDRQMNTVLKNKTDAINRYVTIIKDWYQEHCMKNQYLVNMRKQYAYDSSVVEECIKTFQHTPEDKQYQDCLEKLKKYWNWCNLAFKYGNAFY